VFEKFKRYVVIPLLFVILAIQPAFLGGCKIKACTDNGAAVNPLALNFGTAQNPVNITMWYLFEDPGVMANLASQYKSIHPYTTVTPLRFSSREEYLDALGLKSGTDQAPDVFVIMNDWLPLYQGKLAPMPDINLHREPDAFTNIADYTKLFFPALTSDMAVTKSQKLSDGTTKETTSLYGVPWGVEGMALLANIDHFADYNDANPDQQLDFPQASKTMTWNDFRKAAQQLIKTKDGWVKISPLTNRPTTYDPAKVVHFGAALGYGASGLETNVAFSPDIFTNLLMQNNIEVIGVDRKTVEFSQPQYIQAASETLKTYADYSTLWGQTKDGMPSSVEAFAQGKVSLAFAHSYQLNSIPGTVHYEVIPIPQLKADDATTWVAPAYYWARVVNKTSKNMNVAWDFVKFVASKDRMKVYSEATRIPPARQDLIDVVDLGNPKLKVFAQALPFTQSFYKGNWESFNSTISNMINAVAFKQKDSQSAIQEAAVALEKMLQQNQLTP
jgi:ABC-type glycerol-3-phosphate transport system substrate-binding protein